MGGQGSDVHAGLCAELKLLRLHGVYRARTLDIPHLLDAAATLGLLGPDSPQDLGVESLLLQAVSGLGESREAKAARLTFGLEPGHKLLKAADRRRNASREQGVSIETYRGSYERELIEQLATEILALRGRVDAVPPRALPELPRVTPVFDHEQQVADVLRTAHTNADWDLVEGAYRQCVELADDHGGRFMPDAIPDFLAEALARIAANYHGREEQLILHGLGILGNAEGANRITGSLFKQLYDDARFDRFIQYTSEHDPRRPYRRPCPYETMVETARRFRDLNHLESVLADLPTSCILGGSLNYGRYFSVRGASGDEPGSNVDLVLVLPSYVWVDEVIASLAELHGAARASLDTLEHRARVWHRHRLDDGYTMFSQRIRMWSDQDDPVLVWTPNRGEYAIDLRIMSSAVLEWILVADNAKLTASAAGKSRTVRNFCQRGTRPDEHQCSFSGRNLSTTLETTELDGDLLRLHQVYSIQDDRYYPGAVQNLILPRFNKRWDDVPIEGALQAFRWKIVERLRFERRLRPYELQRVSLSHTRSEMFAPHILRAVDSADIT
ncbi:hypothetical protein [Pseudonocardia acaciae]|uniref:hypothetical protein n=1 Tax=Pseudonocardia acaciae TaxID=551276 RepID=UPI000B17C60A|nr:hypothetical protein [Pseudonocardia acaciae]